MMDTAALTYLEQLIRQEGRSLLQYVNEADPWITPEEQPILDKIRDLAAEERQMTTELAQILRKHRGRMPLLGAYPMSYTNINFLSLDNLLPRLITFENARVAEIQRHLDRIEDEETRAALRHVVEQKQRHLTELQTVSTRLPQPAVKT